MLGKQWLNRYESTEMRGSTIERSQNRQRKLDEIDAWYFDTVMESLPLMLQAALLLLGCALSLYLWGINTTIASVVVGITSFGVIFYLSIIIAGVVTESCPYQTPVSQFICYLAPNLRNTLRRTFTKLWELVPKIPPAIVVVPRRLWRAVQAIAAIFARHFRVHNWLQVTHPTPEPQSTLQTTVLDLRCISWTLHTSFDKAVRTSALGYLTLVLKLANFDPSLVVECFNIFLGSISVNDGGVEVTSQGLELAKVSATCFYRAYHRLTVMDPASRVLDTIHQQYRKDFPNRVDFTSLPSRHTITMIDALVTRDWRPRLIWYGGDRPSDCDHILFAQDIAELAQVEHQPDRGVPRWTLDFAFDSLSLGPLPPAPVVANCLKVIAIDLGCDVSSVVTSDERYTYSSLIGIHILTKSQCESGSRLDTHHPGTRNHDRRWRSSSRCKTFQHLRYLRQSL